MNNNKASFSRSEKFLVSILLMAIMGIGLMKLGGIAFFTEIGSLRSTREELNYKIEELDLVLANENSITASWSDLQPEQSRLETLLPPSEKQPIVIGSLENLLESVHGKINSMRINEKINHSGYSTQNLYFRIAELDTFPSDLLEILEIFPQLLIIESIDWQVAGEDSSTITVSLNLFFAD